MNPLLEGALGSNIAERVQALVWRSHTLSVATPDHGVRDSASILKIWRSVIFAVLSQSAKTANIMRLENLAIYGISHNLPSLYPSSFEEMIFV